MPRIVVFVAPYPTEPALRFLRALASLSDVLLLGVVHTPPPPDSLRLFADVVRIQDPLRTSDLAAAVDVLRRRHGQPYRILGVLESLMNEVAQVRDHFGVAGASAQTALRFRDKAQMKDALREAGLPVARHARVQSLDEAVSFAGEVGFPVVVKPLAGVGARATSRATTKVELGRALRGMRLAPDNPVLVEEMIVGREHSFETITIGGSPRIGSFSDYLPSCIEVLENPWIQWACVLPREIDTPLHDRARAMGVAALRVLGLDDSMTHMEWFERPDGSLAIGEVAQRPPGPQLCQMTGLVHDVDIYRAWALAMVDGVLEMPWVRSYAAGCVFVRGAGRGRVIAVTGVRETHEAIGPWLVEAKLPRIGALKQPGYEGDGYVVVRHPSTAKVQELLGVVMKTMRVHYTG